MTTFVKRTADPTTTSKITLNCFLDTSLSSYEKVKL